MKKMENRKWKMNERNDNNLPCFGIKNSRKEMEFVGGCFSTLTLLFSFSTHFLFS